MASRKSEAVALRRGDSRETSTPSVFSKLPIRSRCGRVTTLKRKNKSSLWWKKCPLPIRFRRIFFEIPLFCDRLLDTDFSHSLS